MRRDEVLDILHRHEADIRARSVTRLALFGSTARDQARDDSDVDLLIDFDDRGRSALEFFGLYSFFSELLGSEVEVVARRNLKRFLKDAILAEALEVFPNPARPPYYPDGVPVTRRSPRQSLEDIKVDISAIGTFVAGRSYLDFCTDGMLHRAVQRSVEIISEASRRLPPELTAAYPDVDWRGIRDIGNVLRHAYPDVQPETIWNIATVKVHPLRRAIEAMIAQVDREEGRFTGVDPRRLPLNSPVVGARPSG